VAIRRNRKHSSRLKAKVAVDAIQERETLPQLASKHQIHASQVSKWKKIALDGLPGLFESSPAGRGDGKDELIDRLYQQIGQLQVELQWLKKKCGDDYWG
jgi:transposase